MLGATAVPLATPHVALAACQGGTPIYGVDVSEDQGTVDWTQVSGSATFGVARIADGTTHLDPYFQANFTGMKAAGLRAGGDLFFRAGQDPMAQANEVISALQQAGFAYGDLVPALDVETLDGQSGVTVVTNLQVAVRALRSAFGVPPAIATSASLWASLPATSSTFAADPLWVMNWSVPCPTNPSGWTNWALWQYSVHGSVPGVAGAVDLDQSTAAQLPLYYIATSTTVSCSPNPILPGSATQCTAAVSSSQPSSPPVSTLQWSIAAGGTLSATTCNLPADAPCTTTYTPAGGAAASIDATYGGDATHLGSTGTTLVLQLIAQADRYAVGEGGTLSVAAPGPLANDSPASGLRAVIAAPPSHGSLRLGADGSLSYRPAPNYVGMDQFTYRATYAATGLASPPTRVTVAVAGRGFSCAGCDLSGLNFSGDSFAGGKLDGANLSGAALTSADLTQVSAARANFAGAVMTSASLVGSDLVGATLDDAQLRGARLSGANLSQVSAMRTDLSASDLTNVNLAQAVMTADLNGAVLNGADLFQATGLNPMLLSGATWGNTTCPDGTNSNKDGGTCLGHL